MSSVVIIFTIYQDLDTKDEISVRSLGKIEDGDIKVIGSRLIFNKYKNRLFQLVGHNRIEFEEFNSGYFKSTTTYSFLLTSMAFYRRFENYKWMLIFQLDSLIIGERLDYFLKKEYTYIGAPWFNDNEGTARLEVGNGGLSLRRTSEFLKVLKEVLFIPDRFWLYYINSNRILQRVLYHCASRCISFNGDAKSFEIGKLNFINEDVLFSRHLNNNEKYRLAPFKEALKFSFETKPSKCYELNGSRLPFGCHAWEKYEPLFWKEKLTKLCDV